MASMYDLQHCAEELLQKVVEIQHLTKKMQTNDNNLLAAVQDLQENENMLGEFRGLQENERIIGNNQTPMAQVVNLQWLTDKKQGEIEHLRAALQSPQCNERTQASLCWGGPT